MSDEIIILKEDSMCQFKGCSKKADVIACGRNKFPLGTYCFDHEQIVIDEGDPEYYDCCPNCGCRFGVN